MGARHPPAVIPPARSFWHTQHPLLSHPRLPRAHSDILRWDVAAAGTVLCFVEWLGDTWLPEEGDTSCQAAAGLPACLPVGHSLPALTLHRREKERPDLKARPACCLNAGQVRVQDEAGPCRRPPFGGCHQRPPLREHLGRLPACAAP